MPHTQHLALQISELGGHRFTHKAAISVCVYTAEPITLRSANSIVASVFGTNDLSVFQTPLNAKVPGPWFQVQ